MKRRIPIAATRRAKAIAHRLHRWTMLARESGYRAAELARLCRVTVRQLERIYQKELGCSPQEWLNHQRMVAAQMLLLESRTVKMVALRLGFKQESHFCREFKRYHEMTPSEFIDLHRRLNSYQNVAFR
ncbi:MAG: helix-turn-helix transcriptional regulator [Verrucomicrobiota bacterium]